MENGPHTEAEFPEEDEVDDDEVPSATSPSEEVEEDDEEQEPLQKRPRRKNGDSGSASSPVKEASVEIEEASESSSGARQPSALAEPLVVPPLGSAPPTEFARMASVSLGSDDDDVVRLVAQPLLCFCRVCFFACGSLN